MADHSTNFKDRNKERAMDLQAEAYRETQKGEGRILRKINSFCENVPKGGGEGPLPPPPLHDYAYRSE